MTVDIKNQTHWTDTKGIATHFNMKPGTIRKQRSKQTKHAFPYHKVGGCVRYSILECEKFMGEQHKGIRMIEKEIYSAKNDATIDAGIGLQQLYREALDNGFEGTIDDFIRTAPKKLLRQILKDGGEVNENSYKQLIDDYDKGIEVIEIDGKKESLTNYIIRMAPGGVE